MTKLASAKIGIIIGFISWGILILNISLLASPLGRTPGPMSPYLIPFILLLVMSVPLSIVGAFCSLKKDSKIGTDRLKRTGFAVNFVYLVLLLGVGYFFFSASMSI